ncbi:MAG: Gfo/Idh/MocA family oxidoreductase, partial [Chloroflexi bacterium]|nr:Gfo/Idh/MocA family oxidoreductase [Chloroflexota bacterium]
TSMLNDSTYPNYVPGAKVVGAYPGGSDSFSLSRSRLHRSTDALNRKYEVEMYDTIEGLARDTDALLLESVDGRQHLEHFSRMAVGKPVFIDKPMATTSSAARAIIELAGASGTPIMSCSALRFAPGVAEVVGRGDTVVSCEAFGPTPILDDYPGLFWNGVHVAEMLFYFMGVGCQAARCVALEDQDLAVGSWRDWPGGRDEGD